jgi:hypothetical protein
MTHRVSNQRRIYRCQNSLLVGPAGLSSLATAAALALPTASQAQESPAVNWTNWNIPTAYDLQNDNAVGSFSPGTTGTVVDPRTGDILTLTVSGEIYEASNPDAPWADFFHPDTGTYISDVSPISPDGSSMLTSTGATVSDYRAHSLSFGQDVTNAVMSLYSLGRPEIPGELTFSQPFIVLSDNDRLTSSGDETTGYKLTGEEGGGVIQFLGTYDRLDWVITGTEIWHGFSIGLTADENPGKSGTYQGEDGLQGWSLGEPVLTYDLYASGEVVEPPEYVDPNAPTPDPDPETVATTPSLLGTILADANALSASLSNVSQNLNDIDGSINVDTTRNLSGVADGINALIGDYDGFGSFSQVNEDVYGVDLPASLLAVLSPLTLELGNESTTAILNPLTLELGNLSTTAIGTLQSGNMAGSFDASGIVNRVSSSADGATTSVSMLAETYGGIADTVAMQNVSVNSGYIDGSVDLILDDVNAKVGNVGTTAIGALQSGAITASVDGTIGSVSHNSAQLVNALVGGDTL